MDRQYSRRGPPLKAVVVCHRNMTALLREAALFTPGYECDSPVAPSDLDRLMSGYRLIQTAFDLLRDPCCCTTYNQLHTINVKNMHTGKPLLIGLWISYHMIRSFFFFFSCVGTSKDPTWYILTEQIIIYNGPFVLDKISRALQLNPVSFLLRVERWIQRIVPSTAVSNLRFGRIMLYLTLRIRVHFHSGSSAAPVCASRNTVLRQLALLRIPPLLVVLIWAKRFLRRCSRQSAL